MTGQNLPQVGDSVTVVTEDYRKCDALVTAVHGVGYEYNGVFQQPCINVVYVSDDEAKRDPYGQQLERMSSLQHFSGARNMPKPGRYWQFK